MKLGFGQRAQSNICRARVGAQSRMGPRLRPDLAQAPALGTPDWVQRWDPLRRPTPHHSFGLQARKAWHQRTRLSAAPFTAVYVPTILPRCTGYKLNPRETGSSGKDKKTCFKLFLIRCYSKHKQAHSRRKREAVFRKSKVLITAKVADY